MVKNDHNCLFIILKSHGKHVLQHSLADFVRKGNINHSEQIDEFKHYYDDFDSFIYNYITIDYLGLKRLSSWRSLVGILVRISFENSGKIQWERNEKWKE